MGTPGAPSGAGRAHARVASTEDLAAGNRADIGARVYPAGVAGLVKRAQAVLAWWQGTRAARANARFGSAGGGVLTGGIAYATLFSVFAGLTIGYTLFMAVLGGNAELRATVLETIAANLPGLIDTGDGDGLIDPGSLVLNRGVGLAGVVAFVVLLVSATSAMAALRTAVRAMFREEGGNLVASKLRELAGLGGIALAILVSAVLSMVTTTAADWALDVLDLGGSVLAAVVLRAVGVGVAFVADGLTFVLIVVLLAGVRPPWRDLRQGALITAVGLGVVRLLGTSVVAASVSKNAVLASFAVIVTLLVWINLIARILLLAAAWTADPQPESAPGEAGDAAEPAEA